MALPAQFEPTNIAGVLISFFGLGEMNLTRSDWSNYILGRKMTISG
jgi:hypothetical protein